MSNVSCGLVLYVLVWLLISSLFLVASWGGNEHSSIRPEARLFHIMLNKDLLCHSLMLLNVAYYAIDPPLLFHVISK